jgi:LPXTG-site transpeptidase (sortase) family protein
VSWAAPPGEIEQGAWPSGASTRRRSGGWWLTAIVLLLAAAATFGLGLRSGQRSLPGPLFAGPAPRNSPPVVSPAARSAPVTLSIPAIGLTVPVLDVGLNSNDTIQVPANYQIPGWYRLGPSPGQRGSAVILGHVDTYKGPAVFFKLRLLRPGDQVNVTLADRVVTHFEVRQIATYLKADFPTDLVYESHGYSGLQLITCGGSFDPQTGHYLSNVVVYTALVSTTPARSST